MFSKEVPALVRYITTCVLVTITYFQLHVSITTLNVMHHCPAVTASTSYMQSFFKSQECKVTTGVVSAVLCCECFLPVLIWFIFHVISLKAKREGGSWWVASILFTEVNANEIAPIMHNLNKLLKIQQQIVPNLP